MSEYSVDLDLDLLLAAPNQWPDFNGYRDLDVEKHEIRLIYISMARNSTKLCASTTHISLDDITIEYDALSYCWGPPGELKTIEVDGQDVEIRASLHDPLQQLCQLGQLHPLWVDAICINQRDTDERNHQVSIMGRIYRSARQTKVWLGEADIYTPFAFAYIRCGSTQKISDSVDLTEIQRRAREAVGQLLRRPYWQRLWVIQEIGSSKHVTVYCGSRHVTFYDLLHSINKLWPVERRERTARQDEAEASDHIRSIHELRRQLTEYDVPNINAVSEDSSDSSRIWDTHFYPWNEVGGLVYWLQKFQKCRCDDVRDKIFGLRSISQDANTILVNYSLTPLDLAMRLAFNFQPWRAVLEPFYEEVGVVAWNKQLNIITRALLGGEMLNLSSCIASAKLTDLSQAFVMDCYRRWRPDDTVERRTTYTVMVRVTTGRGSVIDELRGATQYEHNTPEALLKVPYTEGLISQLLRIPGFDELRTLRWSPNDLPESATMILLAKAEEVQECLIFLNFKAQQRELGSRGFHLSPIAVVLLAVFGLSIPPEYQYEISEALKQHRRQHGFLRLCDCKPFKKSKQTWAEYVSNRFRPDKTYTNNTYGNEIVPKYDRELARAEWRFIDECRARE